MRYENRSEKQPGRAAFPLLGKIFRKKMRYSTPFEGIPSERPFKRRTKRGVPMTDEKFEQAARTYSDTVFRVAYHALRSRPDAEDVTQSVLLKLYRAADEFESEAHLKHWLLRVALNESRKVLRSAWRKRTIPLEDWDGPAEEKEETGVLAAVMALEGKYRVPVYLYYYEGFSVKEIAQALGAKESTIQTRLQRAREKLKLVLTDHEEGTSYV